MVDVKTARMRFISRPSLALVLLILAAVVMPGSAQSPGSNAVLTVTTLATLPGQALSGVVLGTDGNFYGTTEDGGAFNQGTVYRVNSAGVLSTIYSFTGGNDGAAPIAGLALGQDGNFYGTASSGGNTSQDSSGAGTIFRITTNGTFTLLYSFTGGSDGDTPMASLVQDSSGNFYGTTEYGGTDGYGCVFKVTSGGVETNLYSFDYTVVGGSFTFTDGASPTASLLRWSDGSFYGTTRSGGANLLGTVFNISANGNLTTLNSFGSVSGGASSHFPGPQLDQGTNGLLYGTTFSGGVFNQGTVFQMTPAGTLTTLYSFKGSDGASPAGGMVQGMDGMFYGTTCYGGASSAQDPSGNGYGTVFQVSPAGILTNLYSFKGGSDGGIPAGTLIQASDGSFYGTTAMTFFNLGYSIPPFISSQPANQTNIPGETASFIVVAGGTPPLAYQWQLDGTNLPGATASSLILTNVQFAQCGRLGDEFQRGLVGHGQSTRHYHATRKPECQSRLQRRLQRNRCRHPAPRLSVEDQYDESSRCDGFVAGRDQRAIGRQWSLHSGSEQRGRRGDQR